MALELTAKIDAIRLEVSRTLESKEKQPPATRAALKEVLDLLSEAADVAEEAKL